MIHWLGPEEDFVCQCFCPVNHGLADCNDDRILLWFGKRICTDCALIMGLRVSLSAAKRELAALL